MFIFHETSLENLEMILNSGVILRSSEYKKQLLNNYRQGCKKKKLSQDTSALLNNNDILLTQEIDAVYCRLLVNYQLDKNLKKHLTDECVIFLKPEILKTNEFIFNTEENCGFRIDEDWKINFSSINGEPGLSVSKYKDLELVAKYLKFDCFRTEIAILNNIDINDIQLILIKNDFKDKSNNVKNICKNICKNKEITLIYI